MVEFDDLGIDPLDMAVYRTVHDYVNPGTGKKGAVGLAPVMQMPASTVQHKANPSDAFTAFYLKEARALMLAAGDNRALHHLAADVGEACVPLPRNPFPADMDLLEAWAAWQAEVANTVTAIRQALLDGRITADEVARVRAELIGDYSRGLGLVEVLAGMCEKEMKP